MVAHAGRVDGSHALVTVAAATVWRGGAATRFLTVPVARDVRGGLAVYDLPSFASPPARGQARAPSREPLPAVEAGQVEGVLVRFFRGYLAGRPRRANGGGVPARLPGAAGARGSLVRGGSQHDAGGMTDAKAGDVDGRGGDHGAVVRRPGVCGG
jgi:hypothetical protein